MTYKISALTLDKPNLNNRIYPKAVVESALVKYKADVVDKNRALVFRGSSDNLANAVGLAKSTEIENNNLYVTVEFFKDLPKEFTIAPTGMGTLNANLDGTSTVENYEISHFSLDFKHKSDIIIS